MGDSVGKNPQSLVWASPLSVPVPGKREASTERANSGVCLEWGRMGRERVVASSSLGSDRKCILTTCTMGGWPCLWGPPWGASPGCSAATGFGRDLWTSKEQKWRWHPCAPKAWTLPRFSSPSQAGYLSPLCRGGEGTPEVTETFPASRI